MSPAVETSHPPLAHPPGDGTDLHPTPAVDIPIYETPLWLSRPQCLGVRFTVAEMPMGFAISCAWSSNHSRRDVILLLNCDVLAHPMWSQRIRLLRSNMVRQLQHCVRKMLESSFSKHGISRANMRVSISSASVLVNHCNLNTQVRGSCSANLSCTVWWW